MEVWLCSFLEFKTSIHASTTFSGDIRVMPCPKRNRFAQTEADPLPAFPPDSCLPVGRYRQVATS
ncbi:MAG: hypothetical protein ACUZ8N_05800 [Candidatus Scalindua sp.]